MSRAIFLDRDGVICKEKSYISHVSQIEFEYKVELAIKIFKELGYKNIIISNQSGVARGIIELKELEKMHKFIKETIDVDEIYYCPHAPNDACNCRKPAIEMFNKACGRFDIDLSKSYMVGDRATDIMAGKNVGVKTVLVRTGYGRSEDGNIISDFIFENLFEFAEYLRKGD